jgi:hypothetical protein
MSIDVVVLFGSWARGDQTAASDTDLLMIVSEEGPPRHSRMGDVSLFFYARSEVEHRAARGDLFMWHVLFEGRVIYDPAGEVARLRNSAHLRDTYAAEFQQGAALGWMLARFARLYPNRALAARRAAWAARTMLISRAAEAGHPVFGAAALQRIAPIPATRRLIDQKSACGLTARAATDLRRLLLWLGAPDPVPTAARPEDYAPEFTRLDCSVGIGFLEHIDDSNNQYG